MKIIKKRKIKGSNSCRISDTNVQDFPLSDMILKLKIHRQVENKKTRGH